MFLQRNTKRVGSKVYHSTLIVERFRQEKKVKHRLIANISKLPMHVIDGIAQSLRGQESFSDPLAIPRQAGKNFGGLWALHQIAHRLLISKVLGSSRKAMLVLIMIYGRILTQGSRRHLTFWKEGQAIEEILAVEKFDEDDLYQAMDWLEASQAKIEEKLFRLRYPQGSVTLFLYDLTSSYLEGQKNELAEYGYNRDGKKGKKQIVLGLLTDKEGSPIAVEVFRGNTADCKTVAAQVQKLAQRFGVQEAVLVGDRGMIKKVGIESLKEKNWPYITAITKAQIESLIKKGVFQLGLFEEKLVEIEHQHIRYILRRNPIRAQEIQINRMQRMQKIERFCQTLNEKLAQKPKAKEPIALRDLKAKISRLKLTSVFNVEIKNRVLTLTQNPKALQELSRLDGCYVLKTDLCKEKLTTEEVHSMYKNLSFVEWAFRTFKTGFLEIRPLYHRKANRTRACAFIAMLAYMICHHIYQHCKTLNIPLQPLIEILDQIQTQSFQISAQWITVLPTSLRPDQQKIFDALKLKFPKTLSQKLKHTA